MFSWRKCGHIYDPCLDGGRPVWRWSHAQGVNSLLFDDFVRVYCCCREKPDEQGRTVSRVYFVDLLRNDPTQVLRVAQQPALDVGELGTFDEFGMYPFSVVRYEKKLYGYYGGITRCESVPFNAAIGCAIGDETGDMFQRIGKGPVLSYSPGEPFIIGSPKVRIYNGKWYMFYVSGREWLEGAPPEIYYKLRMATSNDGIHWEKDGRNLLEDRLGPTEAQACGDVFYHKGIYHMFFCYRRSRDFRRNKANSYRIGYARSKDLFHWERNDALAGIDVSEDAKAFDNEMVAYPHVFAMDRNIYMLYLGNEVGKYGFGLAQLEGSL